MSLSYSQRHETGMVERGLFVLFLALLLLVPLPFGANIAAGWGLVVAWACLLTLIWIGLWAMRRVELNQAFVKAWPMHLMLFLWAIWLVFQVLPIPISWLEILSPGAAMIQTEAVQILDSSEATIGTISLDTNATYSAILKTIAYICMFNLTLLLINTRQRLKALAWTLVFSGLSQALYGSIMTLSGIEHIFWYEKEFNRGIVTGTFINRNHVAGYLVMCLSIGIGLMVGLLEGRRTHTWRSRLRAWLQVLMSEKLRLRLLLIIMVIALVMTRSRMGNVSFFAAMLVAGVIGLFMIRHARRTMMALIISLIVIDIVVVGAWFGIDQVMERLDKSFVQSGDQHADPLILDTDIRISSSTVALVEERGKVYRDTREYFNDYWLTGSGMGSFRHVYPIYRSGDIQSYYDHAHRDYYEFAVETGAPGLLMVAFMMLYPLTISISAMRYRRNPLATGIAFGVFMSITAMLMHATVDFNLQIPANAATFMVILAIAFIVRYAKLSKPNLREE